MLNPELKLSEQMVTVWPVSTNDGAVNLNRAPRKGICKRAVDTYNFPMALEAIDQGQLAANQKTGRGPFLLAWAPGANKGDPGAPVLYADFSNAETFEDAAEYFQQWHHDIESDQKLWISGWNLERFRFFGGKWLDENGGILIRLIPGVGK